MFDTFSLVLYIVGLCN